MVAYRRCPECPEWYDPESRSCCGSGCWSRCRRQSDRYGPGLPDRGKSAIHRYSLRHHQDLAPSSPQCYYHSQSVQGAELTVSIVVYLTTPFKIQIQIVVAVGRQRQPRTNAVGTSFNRGGTTAVNHAAIFKAKVRLATVINTTTNLHAQQALYQRSAGEKLGGGIISVIPVFLQGLLYGHRAGPLISHFLGDDVDDTTHSVRTIECGHRPTYNLDPLNGR